MPLSQAEILQRLQGAAPQAEQAVLQALASSLAVAWAEPQRAYHTLQHLQECLDLFDAVTDECNNPADVLLALLFHDAIYDPQRHDNEAQSAAWAARATAQMNLPADQVRRIEALVMATQTHVCGEGSEAADTARLLDIDLAILGSSPARFAEYERQIRREYAFVPEPAYSAARLEVMRGFALREPLYLTAYFRERLQAQARRNLAAFV